MKYTEKQVLKMFESLTDESKETFINEYWEPEQGHLAEHLEFAPPEIVSPAIERLVDLAEMEYYDSEEFYGKHYA